MSTLFESCCDQIPVTQDDLDCIADCRPDAPSRYHGVYPDRGGKWQARAFKRRIVSGCDTAREAAVEVVRYWKRRYGERWRRLWRLRQTKAWTAIPHRGGVWAAVEMEIDGNAVRVSVGVGRDGQPADVGQPGVRPFPDRRAAAEGVRVWAAARWGRQASTVLRRAWAPGRNPATPVPLTRA